MFCRVYGLQTVHVDVIGGILLYQGLVVGLLHGGMLRQVTLNPKP